MTTDTDNKRVTDAYRELAAEKAPAELDQKILAMAAAETRTRYGFTRAWIRPAAWTAVIGLSLAFLLDMSQLNEAPVPAETPAPAATPAAAPERGRLESKAFVTEDMSLLRQAEEEASMRAGEARAVEVRADAPASPFHCDSEARRAADSWYECILQLRDEGRSDAASSELEALLEAFPEFREPPPQ